MQCTHSAALWDLLTTVNNGKCAIFRVYVCVYAIFYGLANYLKDYLRGIKLSCSDFGQTSFAEDEISEMALERINLVSELHSIEPLG